MGFFLVLTLLGFEVLNANVLISRRYSITPSILVSAMIAARKGQRYKQNHPC